MENKKITVNVPEGHILKEEKTENGLILTFVKEEKIDVEQEKIDFFRECLNGCTIRLEKYCPNSVFYDKNEKTMFELERKNDGKLIFWANYSLVWSIFLNKYKMQAFDIQSFMKTQVEMILKMGGVTPCETCNCVYAWWK